ncbi:MAG: hypothetical protein HY681_03775 [Chloroflexi bacterium]|nr:hypothetical protein [Chloroflexota bacterium]
MRIAVLGWGSLVWDPRNLGVNDGWHNNGPSLPIEFARKSQDGRLTLVIFPGTVEVHTLWAKSSYQNVAEARENLKTREGTSLGNIGYAIVATREGHSNFDKSIPVTSEILKWAEFIGLDAAVWTDLESNCRNFSVPNAIAYFRGLTDSTLGKAREYVQRAPTQIETLVRIAARQQLDWKNAD